MNTVAAQNGKRLNLVRGLGLWSATAVVIGSMVGQSVFLVGSDMARELESTTRILAAWIVGGIVVLFGAFCYAELGAAMPKRVLRVPTGGLKTSGGNIPSSESKRFGAWEFCSLLEVGFGRFLVRPFTPMSTTSLQRRVTAEFLGTLFLVATVIGSGIMAERLAGTNVALALLANTIATGAILVALIFPFGLSPAHTSILRLRLRMRWSMECRGARFLLTLRHSALEDL